MERVNDILQKCEVALGGWAAGILFNMTVITVLSGIGLWILQVPLVLANAILAGILTFIPNVGPTLSVVPPMVLALNVVTVCLNIQTLTLNVATFCLNMTTLSLNNATFCLNVTTFA